MKKLFIITGEYSGDIHASCVVRALKDINPDIKVKAYKTFYTPENSAEFDLSKYDIMYTEFF